MSSVTVYLRPGCHLCEQALAELAPVLADFGAGLRTVDIETDEDLHRRYLERIPVIALDGAELYDFHLDAGDLRRRLAAAGTE